jgi:hypothetical protein
MKKMPKINGNELLLNSAGKLNKSEGIVYSGCGKHKSIKDYTRKKKHKNRED